MLFKKKKTNKLKNKIEENKKLVEIYENEWKIIAEKIISVRLGIENAPKQINSLIERKKNKSEIILNKKNQIKVL